MSDDILFRFTGKRNRATGKPEEYVVGLPTRDLTAADVENAKLDGLFDELTASPIYKAVDAPKKSKAADDAAKEG